jgi:hypothetical protein
MKISKPEELENKSKSDLIAQIVTLQKEIKSKKYGLVWNREREREL